MAFVPFFCLNLPLFVSLLHMLPSSSSIQLQFKNLFILLQTSSNYQTLYTFSHNWNVLKLFNKPWLCLPLLTFVYLCLPLFKWRIYAQILCLFLFDLHLYLFSAYPSTSWQFFMDWAQKLLNFKNLPKFPLFVKIIPITHRGDIFAQSCYIDTTQQFI